MAKAKCNPQPNEFNKDTEFGRGEIKDTHRVNRKMKHRGKEPYSKLSPMWILNRAFFMLRVKELFDRKVSVQAYCP
ncbi:ribosome alternative rescue factor ArfA [Vibrio parahaemolyticus]|uniref:ribosome alternative rescue factor ArfA n=1 Tax=Vibrio parahaemolyticus TaxID=670 RepID=UPI00111DA3DE|nr:ribosome alternative rescue factor ArfA [Vibrio parahaemolyticus]TON16220.1 ribosome alternative rescue factor ArfA [Vibrio parahaemolyticus]HCG5904602.1 ribosome alternative rescue factor ArfA [Vibrio parahaemolyticus]HCG5908907.1 ribosome alternative rescue factor ArfA [Vibrio parahaemolyticus]HCH1029585.1 ribosome alternative rescue factor ArfA [Vibrio parahaemolyticus]HCH1034025.1 ribosome alternative rescue factor ArfA [Vibrio parahaemolyticus]